METKVKSQKSKVESRIINLVLVLAMAISIGVAAVPSVAKAVDLNPLTWDYGAAAGAVKDWATSGSDNNEQFSFTDFKGGLEMPSGTALDKSLKQAKDLHAFIKKVLDFALGFLGIIAVAIVIYGGFLYVTSAGNEEQSGKGKKAITYAAIGILIILGSFVAVQALVGLNPRENPDATRPSAGESVNVVTYNLGAIGINSLLEDFMAAYKNLVTVTSLVERVKKLPAPHNETQNREYLNEVRSAITQIRDRSNLLTKTHVVAQKLIDGFLSEVASENLESNSYSNGELKTAFEAELPPLPQAIKDDFVKTIDDIAAKVATLEKILGQMTGLKLNEVVQESIASGTITDQDIREIFAGIDITQTVGDLLKIAKTHIEGAGSLKDDPTQTDIVLNVIKSLQRLYIAVRDIPFTQAKIKASVVTGSAPLIVELDGTLSKDPTNQTIIDANYEWDPDGDGKYDGVKKGDNALVTCDGSDTGKPIITCTYNQPGTYVVGLKILSSNPQGVGIGEAHLSITVTPKISKIVLEAKIGDNSALRKIMENDILNGTSTTPVSENEYHATTKEVKNTGITFDASESTDGSGPPNEPGKKEGIKSFNWNFGDGSRPEQKSVTSPHKYNKEGRYTVRLDVTDTGGRADRKIFDVVVGSIAARISEYNMTGEREELFEFDAGGSASDTGAITSYKWTVFKITDGRSTDITTDSGSIMKRVDGENAETKAVFRVKFMVPGIYKVKLLVTDAAGSKDEIDTQKIAIKSMRPRANFAVRACPDDCPDPMNPGRVDLDASTTFDPDPTDNPNLIYTWTFFDQRDTELNTNNFELLTVDRGPISVLSGKTAKQVSLKFTSPGTYKAVLKVVDSTAPEIAQEDTKEKTFNVTSTLEGAWAEDMKTTAPLTNGEAQMTFFGTVKNAENIEIDYGDEQSDTSSADDSGNFKFAHTYSAAGAYLAVLKATSGQNGEITMRKRVGIADANQPLAVIGVKVGGREIIADPLEVLRNTKIDFDASKSIDSQGSKYLTYSWDFGDNASNHLSAKPKLAYTYQEKSDENSFYTVRLTVTETGKVPNTAEFKIKVISKKPTINTLSMEKKTPKDMAPVDVELTAEGPSVEVGVRMTNYQFWYFSPGERDKKMGVVDTPNNHAILTVETSGEEGTENEFLFCVDVTDTYNASSQCSEMFTDEELPRLRIKNGPNKAPIASFTTDRTGIKVGEAIIFTSTSRDLDGTVKQYVWDFDGDGFSNDNPTDQATVTHTYERKSPAGGFKVKLKAIDDKNAAGYTNELPIFVTSRFSNPVAGFTASQDPSNPRRFNFTDASTVDTANGARITKWTWDFDTNAEYGCDVSDVSKPEYCNGTRNDDMDSDEQNPTFDYPTSGTHKVKLTIEDSDGNTDETIPPVEVGMAPGTGATDPATGAPIVGLRANLTAKLPTGETNSTVHIPPNCIIGTANCQIQKVLRVPVIGTNPPKPACSEPITFFWGNSQGGIQYVIDKNIYGDSADGDGQTNNDIDYIYPGASNNGTCTDSNGSPAPNCTTITYNAADPTDDRNTEIAGPGVFRARLTVTGADGTTTADDTIKIIFDGYTLDACRIPTPLPLSGSLFNRLGTQNTILISLVSGVLVVLAGWGISSVMVKGKRRV